MDKKLDFCGEPVGLMQYDLSILYIATFVQYLYYYDVYICQYEPQIVNFYKEFFDIYSSPDRRSNGY